MKKQFMSIDGNTAAAHIAYMFSEVAAIYPITPSSLMAELVDQYANQDKKNIFGSVASVVEMQSEAGAAGAIHGALQAGSYATTFTASQGLLLMIPNIYKMVGNLLPGVIHVAARSIATRALSIFGDHQDIYAIRQTGSFIICSHSVQEVMDLAGVAHLSAIKANVPVVHFFDGFRTSHEIQKIEVLQQSDLLPLLDFQAVGNFRKQALDPHFNPVSRGGAENDDIYFQGREAQNTHFQKAIDIVVDYMEKISKITNRAYAPFTYYGDPKATRVIVAMGSVTETIQEVVDVLNKQKEKVGLIKVHLFRPFSTKHLKEVLPKTTSHIAVLDRSKEIGSREPLYLDVVESLKDLPITIIGGRYGLSSKDTTPSQIKAVFSHLLEEKLKHEFTIGIVDDVTHLSLPEEEILVEKNYRSCLFYGLGSDGTIGANKNSIKIIGNHSDNYIQAYFAYDSKKSGGSTRSHLRFGSTPIRSTYYIQDADFISCSLDSYLINYNMLENIKYGGTFLLNTTMTKETIAKRLPNRIKKMLAEKNCTFYIIDASTIAQEIGMGRRTNTILQSAFFALNEDIMPYEKAVTLMKEAAKKSYEHKGNEIVELNYLAIDAGKKGLIEIEVDPSWKDLKVLSKRKSDDTYFNEFVDPINSLEGNKLPVSAFINQDLQLVNGTIRSNVAYNEHRKIAIQVPKWIPENCIQCGICSFVCPHATIRAFLLTGEEIENAPQDFASLKALGRSVGELKFRIQVSPDNCVGCSLCSVECPGKGGKKALEMVDVNEAIHEKELADYLYQKVEYKSEHFPLNTVKGTQFAKPYFEVSGACAGCGETPYYRLASQLFGKDMLIANATGCSSIYCGSTPSSPFVKDENNQGIAWANSLFEDNAEFGYGMAIAQHQRRRRLFELLEEFKKDEYLKESIEQYLQCGNDRKQQTVASKVLLELIQNKPKYQKIEALKQDFVEKSVWIIGGDGWAYDIGFGGLDHVMANNYNVNVLILDTEVYSNTGGQASKASPAASVSKFESAGKVNAKKDIGQILMNYGHIYIASVAMGANKNQTLKAFMEAESYQGPSLIIAYSPCIEHGIQGGLSNHQDTQRKAVECGYWVLYRYDPRKTEKQLMIDSKEPDFDKYHDFIMSEIRYSQLPKIKGSSAYDLMEKSKNDAKRRYQRLVAYSKIE